MLSGAIACIGFTWIASPACTELEVVMLDWLGKMIGLPEEFLACSGGKGGGVIQGTASEATLVALLGAKAKTMQRVKAEHPDWDDNTIIAKLVGYCSSEIFKFFFISFHPLKLMLTFKFYLFQKFCRSSTFFSGTCRSSRRCANEKT